MRAAGSSLPSVAGMDHLHGYIQYTNVESEAVKMVEMRERERMARVGRVSESAAIRVGSGLSGGR